MGIDNRNLTLGTKLIGRYHKHTYTCEVVAGEGGKLRYRLEDGREFKSPSAAGMAITSKSCNGWAFWSLEQQKPAPAPAAPPTEPPKEPAAEAAPAKQPEATPEPQVEASLTSETPAQPAAVTTPAEQPTATTEASETSPETTETPEGPATEDAGTAETETREQAQEEAPATDTPPARVQPPARKRIYRVPNQKGAPEGMTRWYCHECSKSFLVAEGETPNSCPEGHSAA